MKKLVYVCFAIISISIYGCEKMNDKHDRYLQDGETIYIGKVDSVKAFPGDKKIMFRYWLSDPRAKSLTIYWSNRRDSVIIPVTPHLATDSFDIIIGNQKTIAENNYTFQWISWDDLGNSSVVFEKNATVYGDRYQSRLINKIVSAVELSGNNIVVNWAAPTSEDDIGIELTYTDLDNNLITSYFSNKDLVYEITDASGMPKNRYKSEIENIDFTKGLKYRTLYIPEPAAIDTFYTQKASVEIIYAQNVARGKNAVSSDNLNANFPASNAVDGSFTDPSRWVSGASGEHWLEIDLGEEYLIDGFKTWNGSGGAFNTPIPKFDFRIWVDGAWQTVVAVNNNTNAQYGASFEPVATTKVRFYSYSQTRLFEIEVYSTVRY